ncbi:MAG TPA: hypothetical protein PK109_00505 [Candidatus Paceibacterota bacterium]|nr:hypothetical protein [Candidatus Paceibacterota bacterium]
MNHHAFYVVGDTEEGVQRALEYGARVLHLEAAGNPDVVVLRYGLFPVEEARKITELVSRVPSRGDKKLIVIAATRLFHESQNALLKVFEEPSEGTTIVLIVPSDGVIIPTLRSRLIKLPESGEGEAVPESVHAFLKGSAEEREKLIGKLLDRAKSDKPEEKQAARTDALALANGLAKAVYTKRGDPSVRAFLSDLDHFIPILHERSAPLKAIFEHLLITFPRNIDK